MSIVSYTRLRTATMVSSPTLDFSAPWLNPNAVRRFPIAGYVDYNDILPGPLPSGNIQNLSGNVVAPILSESS